MKRLLSLFVLFIVLIITTISIAQDFPPLDTTGQKYLVSQYPVGNDTYYLMFYYVDVPPDSGVDFPDSLAAVLYKNQDRTNSLFPASVGGKIEMALDTVVGYPHPKSFEERWSSFISRLSKAISDLNITGVALSETDRERAWRFVCQRVALVFREGKLAAIDIGG